MDDYNIHFNGRLLGRLPLQLITILITWSAVQWAVKSYPLTTAATLPCLSLSPCLRFHHWSTLLEIFHCQDPHSLFASLTILSLTRFILTAFSVDYVRLLKRLVSLSFTHFSSFLFVFLFVF